MPVADLGDVRLSYTSRGEGPCLLMIAGTGFSGGTWWPAAIEHLARDLTVVTYDHRGTGGTEGTAGLYSTRMLADDAARLLQHLGHDRAHVAGHSMGARVAQWLALDHPQAVSNLVLLAGGSGEFPGQFPEGRWMTRGVPLEATIGLVEYGYPQYFEHYIRTSMLTREHFDQSPDRAEAIVEHIASRSPELREYLKHSIARQEHQTTERLADLAMPVLIAIGDQDRDIGGTGSHWDQSMYMHEQISHSDLLVIPGGAHGFLWHSPETVEQIAEWLRAQTP